MQTWQWVIVGVFGILVLLALSRGVDRTQPATQGCTVMVRPGQSIQQTIDQASPGAVICLAEGSFPSEAEPDPYPPLLITKDLTLQGAGMAKTVITFGIDIRNMLETGEEPVFHVTLQDLSLQGALRISTHARGRYGVFASNSSHVAPKGKSLTSHMVGSALVVMFTSS
jgi:hypothetical protein